ncbi:amidohydrolase [Fulvivirga lutimaris]|uniref:amidohydrolase n=1 Tax=Fulvivirga lutimaris TaxID=1819566 RepID=UPI0012BC78CE|nr:amidohydrolase [Fulvivirga lutimaris]MTI39061.1 amidohydrolase [Fulvivirga lutimaris]
MKTIDIEPLVALRHQLHQHPELSGQEAKTAAAIINFLKVYNPDQIVSGLGGDGVLAIYNGSQSGPTVTVRCELDALPIQEINDDLPYKSSINGISHKCGHDGHMAMVAGLADLLNKNKPAKGRVILLFQPAEETGEGAQRILEDPKFDDFRPDYIFALHNLPGYKTNQILIKEDVFAAASKGLIVNLEGKTSHAAEPQNGVSPAKALTGIVNQWTSINSDNLPMKTFGITTVVHAQLGERAFGVSPGKAHVMATLRTYDNEDLQLMTQRALDIAKNEAAELKLAINHSETEVFSATFNETSCVDYIKNAAIYHNFEYVMMDDPFRWSEDFGLFTQKYKGAMFGLGIGENQPDLHNPDYDFPDEVIPTGVKMFYSIINQILNN